MTQNSITSTRRRRTRNPRNRPTLITGTEQLQPASDTNEVVSDTEPLDTQTEPLAETASPVESIAPTPRAGFFSKVEKEETTTEEKNVVQARMARAFKRVTNKVAPKATETNDETKATTAPSGTTKKASSTPQRPPTMFKPRHLAGMAVYLLGAQFLLPYEHVLMVNLGGDPTLTSFKIGSFNVALTPSFILNILTLIILLFVLVKFDFLPSGKQFAQQQTNDRLKSQNRAGAASRPAQPAIRQGVKGEDDDLYQAYRVNQRREKKR
ncbi:MAG TPA: hypothetical protein VL461_05480 [Dictyobacter sp.]|jgi:hypothetical protein|nr:hypothetical protein [Dictyobacter sp.]